VVISRQKYGFFFGFQKGLSLSLFFLVAAIWGMAAKPQRLASG
jgi:hypothetical protein